jgi:hypothetical protein
MIHCIPTAPLPTVILDMIRKSRLPKTVTVLQSQYSGPGMRELLRYVPGSGLVACATLVTLGPALMAAGRYDAKLAKIADSLPPRAKKWLRLLVAPCPNPVDQAARMAGKRRD